MRRNDGPRVLVLGGTQEGRRLADLLAGHGLRTFYALAGVTRRPRLPGHRSVSVKRGGFGGEEGLAAFLREAGISILLDATHPFATRMQAQARTAAARTGACLIRLRRRPWTPERGDRWIEVRRGEEIAEHLPRGARVFAALGSRGLAWLSHRGDLHLTARVLMAPSFRPPPRWRLLRAAPRTTLAREASLLKATRARWLVCRNAGGRAGLPRLRAARLLGLPVILLRPPEAQGDFGVIVDDVKAAWHAVAAHLAGESEKG